MREENKERECKRKRKLYVKVIRKRKREKNTLHEPMNPHICM